MAIGETGLDHYWDAAPHDVQAEAFAWHIDLAKRLGKPLMIHDRDAHDDVLADPAQPRAPPEKVIFHCFSGDLAMARICVDAGYHLSFAGPVSFRNARDLAEAARFVPDGQLMVETDAPFLTPHPHRGKRNEPYALPYTVRALAAIRSQDLLELCEHVSLTTRQCVRFARFIAQFAASESDERHPFGRRYLTISLVASSCSHRYPPVITAGMGKSRMPLGQDLSAASTGRISRSGRRG